ncbi:MAG: cupin-like domain-containing protein [Pseudomonadota bacterium]|nr:cupin-like domain-containing protein [Pseudomonadota bacterium]
MRDTTTGTILTDWKEDYARDFGDRKLHLSHSLDSSELFTDEALARLLERAGRENYHVKTTDEGPGAAHREGELGDLSGAEILAAVRRGRIWINIQHPEAVDPAYGEMMDDMYREFEARVPGLRTFKHMTTILISSPGIKVRYHADVPGQMLWQVRGTKRVWVYPNKAPYLRQEALEKLVLKRFHETDMPYDPAFDDDATVCDLAPGKMLYWPLNCPHRVENHDCMNVSVTSEHWTGEIRNAYAVNYANGLLREAGFSRLERQEKGPVMIAKLAMAAAAKLSGATRKQRKPYRIDFRVDPESPSGYRDIDAYEMSK